MNDDFSTKSENDGAWWRAPRHPDAAATCRKWIANSGPFRHADPRMGDDDARSCAWMEPHEFPLLMFRLLQKNLF